MSDFDITNNVTSIRIHLETQNILLEKILQAINDLTSVIMTANDTIEALASVIMEEKEDTEC